MKAILYIFLGGGTGSVLRYLVQLLINKHAATAFPVATFLINITGSILIGIFFTLSERFNLTHEVRLLLTVGLCGGFTTFSTFSADNLNLLRDGYYFTFSFYILGSILLGITGTLLGIWLGKNF